MHVELVRTVTRDGLRLDGALLLHLPPGEGLQEGIRPSAALLLHGVASNFYSSSTFETVIPKLRELGLAVLSVNTRGHDSVFGASLGNVRTRLGAAYETVDDCRYDIAAWIDFLQARGHAALVLIGHSLGAVKAVYGLAREKWPAVRAVVAVSAPRLSCVAFRNSPDSSSPFFESLTTAERMAAEGRGTELFTSTFPYPMLITAAGYVDKYGPAERYNLLRFAHDLPCPALFTYGSKELAGGGIAFAGMPEALQSLPHADRRQVAVIEGADHVYTGVGEQLAASIAAWLSPIMMTSPLQPAR